MALFVMVQIGDRTTNHNTVIKNLRLLCCENKGFWKIAHQLFADFNSKSSRYNFEHLIISELTDEDFMMIIKLITISSNYYKDFRKHKLFNFTLSNTFIDRLIKYLRKSYIHKCTTLDYLIIILSFLEAIITYMPTCELTYEIIRNLLNMTRECFKVSIYEGTEVYDKIEDCLNILDDKDYLIYRNRFHYTRIEIYPSIVDLFETRTVPSTVIGPNTNYEQYLDINFRLLKEDFMNAIEEGFESYHYRKHNDKIKSIEKFDIYRNVKAQIISQGWGSNPVSHLIEFSPEEGTALSTINWDDSKKFMKGSIVFFSQNDFKTFFPGIIKLNLFAASNGEYRRNLAVSIIGNYHKLKLGTSYDMAEPRFFFGQYYQSLKVLQQMYDHPFPMAKHIISVSNQEIKSSLMSKSPFYDTTAGLFSYQWDDLNESQAKALSTALSEKLTLIQGAPGTGKSHIARKIIEILASDVSDERPVLVICLRNKALDIILEPLVEKGIDVIRFGKTDSEKLEKYTLNNMRNRWGENKTACAMFLSSRINHLKESINNSTASEWDRENNVYKLYNETCEALRLHSDYFYGQQILSTKIKVIGATTYTAAKHNAMLSEINPKAVIFDEATEILEPILVSCIPLACDHLILIGDHLQLKPVTSSCQSASKYMLNMSLFERLVLNGKQFCRLNIQYTMRPEIAELICPLIYQDIHSHPSVAEFEDIFGVSKNVFFVNHTSKEKFKNSSRSISNSYEANFIVSLANYLVYQGHKAEEISILAAYSAQQQLIIKKAENYPLISKTVIKCIDNYEGDENNIILLSLVRSNVFGTTGSLTKTNRIHVALSRAKRGLFITGDMTTLAKHSRFWKNINDHLVKKEFIGRKMPLKCKSHGRITEVFHPDDIDLLTTGGCQNQCNFKMTCGHFCEILCHPYIGTHDNNCKICSVTQ